MVQYKNSTCVRTNTCSNYWKCCPTLFNLSKFLQCLTHYLHQTVFEAILTKSRHRGHVTRLVHWQHRAKWCVECENFFDGSIEETYVINGCRVGTHRCHDASQRELMRLFPVDMMSSAMHGKCRLLLPVQSAVVVCFLPNRSALVGCIIRVSHANVPRAFQINNKVAAIIKYMETKELFFFLVIANYLAIFQTQYRRSQGDQISFLLQWRPDSWKIVVSRLNDVVKICRAASG